MRAVTKFEKPFEQGLYSIYEISCEESRPDRQSI